VRTKPELVCGYCTPELVCGYCTLELLIHDPEDHCCDRCRAAADQITVIVIDFGWLLIALGLCNDCRDREVTL
jgi:hypothetical protein